MVILPWVQVDDQMEAVASVARARSMRLSAQAAGEANHGRESYKSNWDCTICASCRNAASVPAALEWPESRVKLRESHGSGWVGSDPAP